MHGTGMNTRARPNTRYRSFDGPALFRQGFRPYFLGAGLWGLLAVGSRTSVKLYRYNR